MHRYSIFTVLVSKPVYFYNTCHKIEALVENFFEINLAIKTSYLLLKYYRYYILKRNDVDLVD